MWELWSKIAARFYGPQCMYMIVHNFGM